MDSLEEFQKSAFRSRKLSVSNLCFFLQSPGWGEGVEHLREEMGESEEMGKEGDEEFLESTGTGE